MRTSKAYWDPEADAVSFDLHNAKSVDGEEIAPGVILHYDKNDRIVEIEFLNFSRRFENLVFPKPEKATARVAARSVKSRRKLRLTLTSE